MTRGRTPTSCGRILFRVEGIGLVTRPTLASAPPGGDGAQSTIQDGKHEGRQNGAGYGMQFKHGASRLGRNAGKLGEKGFLGTGQMADVLCNPRSCSRHPGSGPKSWPKSLFVPFSQTFSHQDKKNNADQKRDKMSAGRDTVSVSRKGQKAGSRPGDQEKERIHPYNSQGLHPPEVLPILWTRVR